MKQVQFLADEDAFEVTFDSETTCQLSNAELRQANGLHPSKSAVESIWIDAETRSGFFVRYADGSEAEASWERVMEQPG